MKLNLIVEDKNIVMPEFNLFMVNDNVSHIVLAIKGLNECEEDKIINYINNCNFQIAKYDGLLYLQFENYNYLFNLIKHNCNINNIKKISIDFLDDNNIIKNKRKNIINI